MGGATEIDTSGRTVDSTFFGISSPENPSVFSGFGLSTCPLPLIRFASPKVGEATKCVHYPQCLGGISLKMLRIFSL